MTNKERAQKGGQACIAKLQVLSVEGASNEVEIVGNVTGIARKLIGPTVRVTVKDERLVMLVQKNGAGTNPLATSIAGRMITGNVILCERRFL